MGTPEEPENPLATPDDESMEVDWERALGQTRELKKWERDPEVPESSNREEIGGEHE